MQRAAVLTAIVIAWLIWAVTAGWHWPDLIGVIPDDAFYYLEGARRAAESGMVSVDGVHRASGYHPGWMILLAGVSRVTASGETLLVQALLISQVLFCLAAVLMMGVIRRLLPHMAGIGAAVWLLNPLTLLLAVQATEAGLYSCLLIGACAALISGPFSGRAERVDASARLALTGVSLGLAFYGRTEVIVIAAVAFLWLPWLPPRPLSVTQMARRVAIPAVCFGAVILPWYVFLYATTGSVEQASGVMKQLWAAEAWQRLGVRHLALLLRSAVGIATIVSCAGLLLTLVVRRATDPRAWRISCWAFSASSVLALVYVVRITDHQIWHLAGLSVLCAVGSVALAAAHGLDRRRFAARPLTVMAVVLIAGGAAWFVTARQVEGYPWQRDLYERQAELETWVPAGEPIAALNAGIPTFFSTREIVAVDGLMNDSLVPFWQRKEADVALRALGLRYLIDNDTSLRRLRLFSTPELVADELHCVPQRGLYARLCVWRLR
jgi:hypothetical protein